MLSDLHPREWTFTKIDQIADKCTQRKPSEDEEFIYVDIGSIDRDAKIIADPQYLSGKDAPSRARKVISTGDVIVSLTRPNLNAVALVDDSYDGQIASTGFEVLKPILVESRYLFAVVRSRAFVDAISGKGQGALYPAAKAADVREYEIPLPPLAEQQQIAARLDVMLAQVDSLKNRLDTIPVILKRFRQSVLAAAVCGRLTEEWRTHTEFSQTGKEVVSVAKEAHYQYWIDQQVSRFEAAQKLPKSDLWKDKYTAPVLPERGELPELPDVWEYACAESVVEPGSEIVYGIVQPGPKLDEGVPYVRGTDIQDGKIKTEQLLFTSPEIANKYQRASLQGDDILLGIIRATKVAIVPSSLKGANITQGTARFRPSSCVLTKYLAFYLESPKVQAWLHSNYRGIDMPGLNLKDVRQTPVAIPSLEEQAEIVRRVEQLFAFADQIEQRVKTAQSQVNHLTQSILAKAFRGDLTAEWREQNPDLISGENSAETLLARIQMVQGAINPSRNSRGKQTKEVS